MLKRNPEIVLESVWVLLQSVNLDLSKFEYNLSCNESTLHVQSALLRLFMKQKSKPIKEMHILRLLPIQGKLVVDDILDYKVFTGIGKNCREGH
ncbi:hypothetical protein RIF29_32181 [Crotalaria pallida]|uniref:Stalled ribosome sensor GCN1-like N-terminal domain-containing protein n=1 Tax=Crotalaria pallida TaxID=3830 RepID=A0AAN9EQ25_CROPI